MSVHMMSLQWKSLHKIVQLVLHYKSHARDKKKQEKNPSIFNKSINIQQSVMHLIHIITALCYAGEESVF